MRIWIVGHHNPEPEGTASGRAFWALGEGLIAAGHELSAVSWAEKPPADGLPAWCEWRGLPRVSPVAVRARALWRPRSDVVRLRLEPPADALAVADDPESFAAVERSPRNVVTIHYLTRADAKVRRPELRDVQDLRAERRAWRAATVVTAYSDRVARGIGPRAIAVPIACPMPDGPVDLVDEPIAALLADWRWPPNARALTELRRAWPVVRARVAGARLLLAGAGLARDASSTTDGVEVLGTVARAADVLSRAAVLAFPCPDSSGPKVKVIEALAHGVPVVTTPPGMEGVFVPEDAGAVVATTERFAETLASVLADPASRAPLAAAGRRAVIATHSPLAAARARVAVFGGGQGRAPAS